MPRRISRRQILKGAGLGAAALVLTNSPFARGASPNEKLSVALIGIGGRGADNLAGIARESAESIVALCDVDDQRAGKAFEKYPKAKKYADFRRMLEEMDKQIDAVVVSTPDHTHFHPAMMAMQMGKHCYCEKPMAHAVGEVRQMTELAAKKKLATQLGAQRHALDNMHRVVELVQSGAIGEVRECHAWIGGDRGMPEPPKTFPPAPSHLDWDLWLGPAAERPYSPEYVPYKWRFWWDFGTGETGNWGCHVLDIPYWALGLSHCTKVAASGPPVDPQRTPKSMAVEYEFPARGKQPPLVLHWYHTKNGPPILKERGLPHFSTGVLFVGSEGMLLCDFGKRKLYPEDKFAAFQPPPKSIPDSPGFYKEWIQACKGGPAATCNFDYTGPMAETVLLGNTAYRLGRALTWDAAALRSPDCPEIDAHIHPTYRKGWQI